MQTSDYTKRSGGRRDEHRNRININDRVYCIKTYRIYFMVMVMGNSTGMDLSTNPDCDCDRCGYVETTHRKGDGIMSDYIRCKDCKYYEVWQLKSDYTDDKRFKPSVCVRGRYALHRPEDWYCADAERRTDG